MFGLPEGRQHRVETAAVADTESAQGKQFPKQELRGYVHKVLQNTFVRYNHWMSEGCNRCMS